MAREMAEMQSVKPKGVHRFVRKTAEDYAFEGIAADMSEHIIFHPEEQDDLDSWLENNLPSKISRSDNIGWIVVFGQGDVKIEKGDPEGLLTEWSHLKESGASINRQLILELGKRYKVVAGKWLIHVQTGYKVDILWSMVASSLRDGVLSHVAHSAKVSPRDEKYGSTKHVICVYNKDYTDYDNVCTLERALRQTGIRCRLLYKPDVFTYLGIYPNNEWGLRPTIYESHFDVLKKESTITELSSLPSDVKVSPSPV